MIPTIAVPHIQTPPPVLPDVIHSTGVGSGARLQASSVVSPLGVEGAYNNSHGTGGAARLNVAQAAAASLAAASQPQTVTTTLSFGFSSPFLTQLLAQSSPAESASLAKLFTVEPQPIADPATMEAYSLVKYKPSNASLPRPERPSQPFVPSVREPAYQPPVQQVQPQQQVQPAPAAAAAAPVAAAVQAVSVAPAVATVAAPVVNAQPAIASAATRPAEPRASRNTSLITQSGVDAYVATGSRNSANLEEIQATVEVDL